MEPRQERLRVYRRARRKFSLVVYVLTIAWMILSMIQWVLVSLLDQINSIFKEMYYISIITFCVGMLLMALFIFFERVRFIIGLNWLLSVLIVECIIIGMFCLVCRAPLVDLILWFAICVVLILVFVLLGSIIPHDLTLDVVMLFVLAFIFLTISIFFIMLHLLIEMPHSFDVFQGIVSIIILLFVMYHAQTINGGRFAEMRLNDHLLASLILFNDFIILFMLSFYPQLTYKLASKDGSGGSGSNSTGSGGNSSGSAASTGAPSFRRNFEYEYHVP